MLDGMITFFQLNAKKLLLAYINQTIKSRKKLANISNNTGYKDFIKKTTIIIVNKILLQAIELNIFLYVKFKNILRIIPVA